MSTINRRDLLAGAAAPAAAGSSRGADALEYPSAASWPQPVFEQARAAAAAIPADDRSLGAELARGIGLSHRLGGGRQQACHAPAAVPLAVRAGGRGALPGDGGHRLSA